MVFVDLLHAQRDPKKLSGSRFSRDQVFPGPGPGFRSSLKIAYHKTLINKETIYEKQPPRGVLILWLFFHYLRGNMLLTIISKIDAKLCEEFSLTKHLEFIHICVIYLAKTNINQENIAKWLLSNSYLLLLTREFFREIFNSRCQLLVHKKKQYKL